MWRVLFRFRPDVAATRTLQALELTPGNPIREHTGRVVAHSSRKSPALISAGGARRHRGRGRTSRSARTRHRPPLAPLIYSAILREDFEVIRD